MIIQSGIAIAVFAGLVGLEMLSRYKAEAAKWHTEALVTGLISFHKMQCYFANTALVLAHDSRKGTALLFNNVYLDTGFYRDFLHTSVLVLLALSGIISITVSLACVTRYGRTVRPRHNALLPYWPTHRQSFEIRSSTTSPETR